MWANVRHTFRLQKLKYVKILYPFIYGAFRAKYVFCVHVLVVFVVYLRCRAFCLFHISKPLFFIFWR